LKEKWTCDKWWWCREWAAWEAASPCPLELTSSRMILPSRSTYPHWLFWRWWSTARLVCLSKSWGWWLVRSLTTTRSLSLMSSPCLSQERLSPSSLLILSFSKGSWRWWSRLAESKIVLAGITRIQALVLGYLAQISRHSSLKSSCSHDQSLLSSILSSQWKARLLLTPSAAFLTNLRWVRLSQDKQLQTSASWLHLRTSQRSMDLISTTIRSQSTIARMTQSRRCC